MSYLEKLLDGVEVEWKTLGSIAELKRGTSITKKDVIDGTIPVVAGGRTPAYYHNTSNRDGQTIVIAGSGAYAGFVSWWEEPIFVSDAFTVKPHNILLPRYCYHFLMNMQQQLHEFKSGGGVPHVYPRDVSPILIPIPCPDNPEKSLAIQSEIVRILDKFTALTAELTAELTMRKKQYNYYRDQLLSFEEGEVEWKTLGEVAVIGTGNHDTQDAIEHGKYIFYARGREPLKLNVFDFDETAIITAGDGAGVGKVFHYAKGKYALHQRAYRIVPNAFMNPRFVYHYITAYFFTYIQKASVSSSVTSLRRPMFLKFPIPVPPSEEQARIVEILDKFDTLTNSITEGLPREIELRQKQYEYYRDLLFSFPKPEAVSK
ncbi:restriction endonuclease subunit S [Cronobacter sakazakii]|nr:restriction endonuclease subunit S [Cronobacter sakazakii]